MFAIFHKNVQNNFIIPEKATKTAENYKHSQLTL